MTAKEATPAPAEVAKAPKIEQNGVTRPKAGTSTGRVWDISDAISKKHNRPAGRAEVLDAAKTEGLNAATVATQFGRWCKFFGVKPEPKAKVQKAPKPPKEPKAPKAAATVAPAAPAVA